MQTLAQGIFYALVFFAALAYFGRKLVLWYWRVDELIELLREIRDRLPPAAAARPAGPRDPEWENRPNRATLRS